MTKQGSRPYQKARYRDLVRPAVNVYNTPTKLDPTGVKWGARGVVKADLACLAKAARAAGRGFTYARVSPRSGRVTFAVPLFSPL